MLKKAILASLASAALALLACSSDDGGSNGPANSSPSGENISSGGSGSSSSAGPAKVTIASFPNNSKSELLGTYPYGYTLKEGEKEDLEQFWKTDLSDCPLEVPSPPSASNEKCGDKWFSPLTHKCVNDAVESICEKNKENAILQNELTNHYSPLHYVIDKFPIQYPNYAIKLVDYKLTAEGDQAALGLNVGEGANEGKTIEDMNITALNGTAAFTYKYEGGAHSFRLASTDADYWFYDAPAKAEMFEITIQVSDLKGAGVFAPEEGSEESVPFDLSKVAKFLWAVEYSTENAANTGSLLIDDLKAVLED
jgi:hypothetical protein